VNYSSLKMFITLKRLSQSLLLVVLATFLTACGPEKQNQSAPTAVAMVSPMANEHGWHNSEVTVVFECHDVDDDLAFCSDTVILAKEGHDQIVRGGAVDKENNKHTIQVPISIDTTAPTLTTSFSDEANSDGWWLSPLTITYSAGDELSGIDVEPPTLVINESAMNHKVVAEAVDLAGNKITFTKIINIDLAAPTVKIIAPQKNSVLSDGVITLIFDYNDDLPLPQQSLEYTLNGEIITPQCQSLATSQRSCLIDNAMNIGENVISITVTDVAGRTTTESISLFKGVDSDGDGVIDLYDRFPNNANEWQDLDNDGVGDNSDPDRDGDNVANENDAYPDNSALTALEKITALRVSAQDSSSLNIGWSEVGEDSAVKEYQIFRAPWGGTFTQIATLSRSTTTFIDLAVENNKAYQYYVVTSNQSNITSSPSETVSQFVAYNNDQISDFSILNRVNSVQLSWTLTAPDEILLYHAIDDGPFSLWQKNSERQLNIQAAPGHRYHYKALNRRHFYNPITQQASFLDGEMTQAITADFSQPAITIDGATALETTDDSIVLTGHIKNVADLASITANSNQFDQTFSPTIDQAGNFSIELPLELTINTISFVVTDSAQYTSEVIITVTRRFSHQQSIEITSHAQDQTVTSSSATIIGYIYSNKNSADIVLTLASKTANIVAIEQGKHQFTLADVTLAPGVNSLMLKLVTSYGEVNLPLTLNFSLEGELPSLTIDGPLNIETTQDSYVIHGKVSNIQHLQGLQITGDNLTQPLTPVPDQSGMFSVELAVGSNTNSFTFTTTDITLNTSTTVVTITQTISKVQTLEMTSHQQDQRVTTPKVTLQGRLFSNANLADITVMLGSQSAQITVIEQGVYQFTLPNIGLVVGMNNLVVKLISPFGTISAPITLNFTLEGAAPNVTIDGPLVGETTQDTYTLTGRVSNKQHLLSLSVTNSNNQQLYSPSLSDNGQFSLQLPLGTGVNNIVVTATDTTQSVSEVIVEITKTVLTVQSVNITSHSNDQRVTTPTITLKGNIYSNAATAEIALTLGTQTAQITRIESGQYQFSFDSVSLVAGDNTFDLNLTTTLGTASSQITINYSLGNATPVITIEGGLNQSTTQDSHTISGIISNAQYLSSLTVSSSQSQQQWTPTVGDNGTFSVVLPLEMGINAITFRAIDVTNISSAVSVTITRTVSQVQSMTITSHSQGEQVTNPTVTITGQVLSNVTTDNVTVTLGDATAQISVVEQGIYQFTLTNIAVDVGVNILQIKLTTPFGEVNTPLSLNYSLAGVAPVIEIEGPLALDTTLETVTLTGQVRNPQYLVGLVATSSTSTQQTVISVEASGQFSIELPLVLTNNIITLTATDSTQNTSQVVVTVTRNVSQDQSVTVTSHVSGVVVTQGNVSVAGVIVSNVDIADVIMKIGANQAIISNIEPGKYQFVFNNVMLSEGPNTFELLLSTPFGNISTDLIINYSLENIPPQILSVTPVSGEFVSAEKFILAGTIYSPTGIETLTINGEAVYISEPTNYQYSFSYWANFNGPSLTLALAVTANNQKSATQTLNYTRDLNAPVINVSSDLLASPAVNNVIELPMMLQGSVTDDNISSVTLNDRVVELVPGSQANEYTFDIAVNIPTQIETELVLKAFDQSGNQTSKRFVMLAASAANIDLISPSENAEFAIEQASFNLQVLANIKNLNDNNRVRVTVDTLAPIFVDVEQTLINTSMMIEATTGQHKVLIEVLDGDNAVAAATSRMFSMVVSEPQEVAIVSTQPQNGATGVEPNDFVVLYLNQAIDPDLLTFEVRETANGQTYINNDVPGVSFLQAKGYQLQEVSRNSALVSGDKGLLPGDNVIAFYPNEDFAYSGKVFVTAHYQGAELARFNFEVRPLPTFLSGNVLDQLNQVVTDVTVEIPQLNRTTTTNSDGVFSFGAGDTNTQSLPGGAYELVINPDFKNPNFGIITRTVIIEQGRKNDIPQMRLPMLDQEIAFMPIESGKQHILAAGELSLDLSQAQVTFPNGAHSGLGHVSFMEITDTDVMASPKAFPGWVFAVQPMGITVSGQSSVSIAMPKIYNSHQYVPANGTYLVLVGRNGDANALQPIGVGEIDGYNVVSVQQLDLKRLDYIGYAFVADEKQQDLARFANGELSLAALIGLL